jgi:glutaredoxin
MYSVIPLEKQHFRVTKNGGALQVTHPVFKGRAGYVLFFSVWCPQCQDTKTTWFALGVVRGNFQVVIPPYLNKTIQNCRGVQKFPHVQYIRSDGMVVDIRRHDAKLDPQSLVDYVCKKTKMCCNFLARPYC